MYIFLANLLVNWWYVAYNLAIMHLSPVCRSKRDASLLMEDEDGDEENWGNWVQINIQYESTIQLYLSGIFEDIYTCTKAVFQNTFYMYRIKSCVSRQRRPQLTFDLLWFILDKSSMIEHRYIPKRFSINQNNKNYRVRKRVKRLLPTAT